MFTDAEIPARFIAGADPSDVLAGYGLKAFAGSKNGIFCISGPPESGKTTVMTAMLMRAILRLATRNNGHAADRLQYLYLDAARTFRTMRKLSLDEDLEHPAYWVPTLALDDLDKVEPQYRSLVRDVIVYREQNAMLTLVSLTDAKMIRECGDQVYRRITAAMQLPLRKHRISANFGGGSPALPAQRPEGKAQTLPGIELSA